MKYNFFILLLLLLTELNVYSRVIGNNECDRMFNEAKDSADIGRYEIALKKLAAAKICNPKETKYDSLIIIIYQDINRQKENAVEAKKKETVAKDEAVKQKIIVQNQLARNYWNSSQGEREKNNLLEAFYYSTQAVVLSKDKDFTRNVLTDVETFLPQIVLKNIFIDLQYYHPYAATDKMKIISAIFSGDGQRILTLNSDHTARLLESRTGKQIGDVMKHQDQVLSAAFSPDGKQLVTTTLKNAFIWDATTGKQTVAAPITVDRALLKAIFSPNGKQILTTNQHGDAHFWDAYTGASIGNIIELGAYVYDVVFSPDGRRILAVCKKQCNRGAPLLWDLDSGKLIPLEQKNQIANSTVFSPDGKKILASNKKGAYIWDVKTGELIEPVIDYGAEVNSAVFSPDGKKILTARKDGKVFLWDAESLELIGQPMIHESEVNSAVFSPDGKMILTACEDGNVLIWDACTKKRIGYTMKHANEVIHAVFSFDGKQILTVCEFGSAHLWAVLPQKTGYYALQHKGNFSSSAVFSRTGKSLLTAGDDDSVRLWETGSGMQLQTMEHGKNLESAIFSPNEKFILTSSDSVIRLWNTFSGQPVGQILKYSAPVLNTSFLSEKRQICSICKDGTIQFRDELLNRLVSPDIRLGSTFSAAVFSPDGKRVLTEGSKTLQVWDVLSGKRIGQEMEQNEYVYNPLFSADGRLILTTSDGDSTVRIWDAFTGKPVGLVLKHEGQFIRASFSSDSRKVLTGSDDKKARLWDAYTGKPIGPVMKCEGEIADVTFSPDGKWILTASDSTMQLWETGTGKHIGLPMRHLDVIRVAFSPDGTRILSTGNNTTLLWNIGGDLDIPEDLFDKQSQAVTGCRLNTITNEIEVLPANIWFRLNEDYNNKAKQHYKTCKYPEHNFWRRFNSDEALKIRPEIKF